MALNFRFSYIKILRISICTKEYSRSTMQNFSVGSSGSLFAWKIVKQGHQVYSIDTRKYHEKHKNLIAYQGDIKIMNLMKIFFDIITCISMIENIGLSAYGDSSYDNDDKSVMQKFKKILKKQGKLIISIPFAGKSKFSQCEKTIERNYVWKQLNYLFENWRILIEEYYIPHRSKKDWILTDRKNAEQEYLEYPKSNLVCFVLERCD